MSALYDSKTKSIDDRGIRELLTERVKFQSWLDVEAALALAQAELGVIPQQAADQIAAACKLDQIDLDEVVKLRDKIGHGFVPFLKQLVKACPDDSGKYVHIGVTTQNIQQTAQLLVTKKVNARFLLMVGEILANLAQLAEQHSQTVMPGRTHGRHAEPITYGFKASVWIDELLMTVSRLQEAEPRVFSVMMGGPVGAFNASGQLGRQVQTRVATRLEMTEMAVPSRNIGTHKVEYVMALCLLASVCHKMAEEMYSTSLEEIGEVLEGFAEGTVGSSSLPHKINPKLAKGIIANAQKLYSLPAVMLSSCCRPYEGDSSSYMLLESCLHESLELMTEIILRTEELTRCLQVNQEKMRANTEIKQGLDNSGLVMMNLALVIGKDQAHTKMYALAMNSTLHNKSFLKCLQEDTQLATFFSADELETMVKPENYTGQAIDIAREMAQKAKQAAAKLIRK
ncbi:lyase family protein [Serratia sp. PAMC26656]|uniref:lyase family protein n=1 Tax=Serratia sp. PAMC26656 TaxID=2775909 RepID=UPI0018F5663C|nr:lyase family protein [Serratia sp. PAMC26656]MBJ7890230.1 adenylosuccinate lyase family protein [Serratia sp. PAMC26656]